jgi:hypothetical protein
MGPIGDKFTAQLAMTTLERIGEEPAKAPVQPPAEPAPEEEDDEPPAKAALKVIRGDQHGAE